VTGCWALAANALASIVRMMSVAFMVWFKA
jgi:hypothetical protein